MSENDRSRRGDEALISGLLSGLTIRRAAREANVSEATARRRLATDAFQQQLAAAKNELIDSTVSMLIAASGLAVHTLLAVARHGKSESARVSAARTRLEMGLTRPRHGAVSAAELEKIVGTIIGLAVERLTEQQLPSFLHEVDRALLGPSFPQ